MTFLSFLQRLRGFRRGSSGRLGLEWRPDGVAWASCSAQGEVLAGFVEATSAQREEVLATLAKAQGWGRMALTVVLPPDLYQVFQLEKPPVESAELADAVRWKIKDMLDYPVDEAVLDVYGVPLDAARGRGELINAVVARKALLREVIRVCDGVGLSLQRVDVAELSLRDLLVRLAQEQRTAGFVYLRQPLSQMVLCRGDVLYLARRVDFSATQLADVAQQENAVQSLALELQRSLDYFESQLGQIPPRRLMLIAPEVRVPLAMMLNANLAAEVVDLDLRALLGESGTDVRVACALGAVLAEEAAE